MVHDAFSSHASPGDLAGPGSAAWRPLSRASAGQVVVVRRLEGSAETNQRLREMGLVEHQRVRVISHQSQVLCQVCHARLGVSARMADLIIVEPLGASGVGLRLPA